jgi:hypothetical protein
MLNLNKDEAKTPGARKKVNPAVGFGSSFAGGMAVFGLGGHWLDVKTGKDPLFTLLGIGLGLLYGAWELWKLVTISNQQAKDEELKREGKEEERPDEPVE